MVKAAEFLHQVRSMQKGPPQEYRDPGIDAVVDGASGGAVRSDLRSSCSLPRDEQVLLPLVHGSAMPCGLPHGH